MSIGMVLATSAVIRNAYVRPGFRFFFRRK